MVRLYAWVMIAAVGLTTVVALKATSTEAQYAASAEVLIAPTITPSGNYIQPSMPTEQRVATSADVVARSADKLKITPAQTLASLSVSVPVDTQVLVMTYTDDTAAAALAGAKAVAESFLKVRNPANGKNEVASLVGPPDLPSTPVAANYAVVLGVAILGGLLIGFAIAWAWDRVRGRLRTVAEAERRTGLDSLAVLPRPSWTGDLRIETGRPQLDSLAARVLGQVEGGPQFSLLVTGVGPGCNSTAVAVQTARALARMGRVAILVTADPDAIACLAPGHSPGSQTALANDASLDSPEGRPPGLHLVPIDSWDSDGFAAAKLTNLLPELHDRMPEALVVIDGPTAWESAGIALGADRILLVVATGRSSRASTRAAVQALDHCSEKLMGLVNAPRRGRRQVALAAARAWALLRVRRAMSRVAPLAPEVPVAKTPMLTVLAPVVPETKVNGSAAKVAVESRRVRSSKRAPTPRREQTRSSVS